MQQVIYIPDIFKDIISKVSNNLLPTLQSIKPLITGVHFMSGHYIEIQNRLISKGKSDTEQFNRYPLICLFQDFIEDRKNDGYYATLNLQFMILYHTSKDHYREDRTVNVYKPILYPIYIEFLKQLTNSGYFNCTDDNGIIHQKIERPHWGNPAQYGNDGYILADVLDGIELRNLQLKMYNIEGCTHLIKNI